MPFVKSISQKVEETDVENTESYIADEVTDYESDNLSIATDSSDDSEKYIQNDEHSPLSKDGKYNWVCIIPQARTGRARAENIITAHLGKYYPMHIIKIV